jgi:hypothetical protein
MYNLIRMTPTVAVNLLSVLHICYLLCLCHGFIWYSVWSIIGGESADSIQKTTWGRQENCDFT